jgi:hypothetical protein
MAIPPQRAPKADAAKSTSAGFVPPSISSDGANDRIVRTPTQTHVRNRSDDLRRQRAFAEAPSGRPAGL